MKYSAAVAIAAIAAGAQAQGVASGIAPAGGSPPGCITTGNGYYQITVVQPAPAAKRDLEKRAECGANALVFKLDNGILTDRQGRIGSIVANRQFQFDGPPAQTGAIYTGGFSVCGNTSLAIGPTTNFYQCLSGDFYNLYDQPSESSCRLVKFNTIPCTLSGAGGASSAGSSAAVSSQSDGQPTASSAVPVSSQPDGQPTAGSATTAAPTVVSQQSDGQPTASSAPVVSQISDGQPQATNGTPTTARPSSPVVTGAATHYGAAGAVAVIGAAAALLL